MSIGKILTSFLTIFMMMLELFSALLGGGGGEGLFRFDWGASYSFQEAAAKALMPYRI